MLSVDDRSAIMALHDAWLTAELRGDSSALLKLCTAAPVWLPPNESPLSGRDAIVQWIRGHTPVVVRRIEIDDLAISGIGSFAWKLASFRTTFGGSGDTHAAVVTGSHGWLLQRDDAGDWRVSVVTWTITQTA